MQNNTKLKKPSKKEWKEYFKLQKEINECKDFKEWFIKKYGKEMEI